MQKFNKLIRDKIREGMAKYFSDVGPEKFIIDLKEAGFPIIETGEKHIEDDLRAASLELRDKYRDYWNWTPDKPATKIKCLANIGEDDGKLIFMESREYEVLCDNGYELLVQSDADPYFILRTDCSFKITEEKEA
jgi:hypothetical protein